MIPLLCALFVGAASADEGAAVTGLHLDFGPEGGASLEGWDAVTPFSSESPAVHWVSPPKQGRALSWLDGLGDDHVQGGTLHLDLAPGTYTIAAMMQEQGTWYAAQSQVKHGLKSGETWLVAEPPTSPEQHFSDPLTTGVARPRFGPSSTPWERQLSATTRWRVDTLVVGEGGVDLSAEGRSLAALIVSTDDPATVEVELALVDARRREDWLEAHGVWPDPGPLATEGLIGVEPFPLDGWPTGDGVALEPSVRVALAPGERRVVQFAVHGSDAPAAVRAELPKLTTRLYEVDWLDVRVSHRTTRPTPHVLRPLADGSLRGGQGLVPVVAVEIAVPRDAEPGVHEGQVIIERDGTELAIPVQVRVRELHLAEAPVPWGFWADLRGPIGHLYGPNSDMAKSRWRSEVELARRWGAERVSIRGAMFPGGRMTPALAESQFERITWAVETFRQYDPQTGEFGEEARVIPGDVQWHDPKFNLQNGANEDPLQPIYDEAATDFLRQVFAKAAELDLILYVSDEETLHHGPGFAPILRRRLSLMRELAGDVELSMSSPHTAGWPLAAEFTDRVYTNASPQLDHRHLRYFDHARTESWAYNYGWHREASGVFPWAMGAEGLLIWHYNDTTDGPYNEFARRRRYAVVAPGESPAEALATRRLIRLGHGGFDQRYYGTLALLVEELGDRKSRKVQEAVDHACGLLRVARSGVEGRAFDQFQDYPLRDAGSLQALQAEIGSTAEHLARWSKAQRAITKAKAEASRGGFMPSRCELGPRAISPHRDPDGVPPLQERR